MARVSVGMVLSIFLFFTLSIHYMGRRFLYSDLTRLHTWTLSNVSKTRVQNRTTAKEKRVAGRSSPTSSEEAVGQEYKIPSMYWIVHKSLHIASSRPKPAHGGGKCENRHLHSTYLLIELPIVMKVRA